MLKRLIISGLIIVAVAAMVGCEDDPPVVVGGEFNTVLLRPERFPTLFEGLVYEVWLTKFDEDSNWVEPQSLGRFFWNEFDYRFLEPDANQAVRDSMFKLSTGDVYDYEMIAITLEEYPTDESPDPSATIVAQSRIVRDISTFMRFPVNFDGIEPGTFVVATFSDGNWRSFGDADTASERYGIWFLNLTLGGTGLETDEKYADGITLPVLPDTGYLYEGWVALEGGDTVSTGKFFYPDYLDYDNSHCKLRAIPNFPGEDFLVDKPAWIKGTWPLEITRGGVTFVTVEPNPDNDLQRPSNLVVLRGNLPKRTPEMKNRYRDLRSTNFPIGSVAGVTFPKLEAVFLHTP
ncbi:MAG: anti-sigma factor [Candidatus Zixiibacteriota bacterium]